MSPHPITVRRNAALTGLVVVVPGLETSKILPTLVKSLFVVSASLRRSNINFQCLVYVSNRTLLEEATAEISQCDLVFNEGLWTHHMKRVNDALIDSFPGDFSHVAILDNNVDLTRINASAFLETMHRANLDAASAATEDAGAHDMVMRPRSQCRSHRTDFADVLFKVFTRDAWRCWHGQIDLEWNALGWGYNVALADNCNASVGIVDDAIVVHAAAAEASSHDAEKASNQIMFAWMVHSMTGVITNLQARIYHEFVTNARPKLFPYCEEYRTGPQGDACSRVKDIASCDHYLTDQQGKDASVGFILVDNSYFMISKHSHRGGWKSIMDYLIAKCMVEDIDPALREFVWNKAICSNSAGQQNHDIAQNEYFRSRLHCKDACGESRQKYVLVDNAEKWFIWNKRGVIDVPWIGITHMVFDPPSHTPWDSTAGLFNSTDFLASLSNCVGMVVLAKDQVESMELAVSKHTGLDTARPHVCSLVHPITVEESAIPYDPQADLDATFLEGHGVILLGQQYRRIATIHRLQTKGRPKFWVPGSHKMDYNEKIERELVAEGVKWDDNVTIVYEESFDKYDKLVKQNIAVIDLWVATANNAILEAIALEAPVFVRRLASTVEYLGKDYPLFFSSFDELQSILLGSDDELRGLLLKGHLYLKQMNKSRFSMEKFGKSLQICAGRQSHQIT